jgi:hypothetical protein
MTSKEEEENGMLDKGLHLNKTENSNVVDIPKANDISKDILDITDTPDVAVWNKSVQNKSNDVNMIRYSKRENGEHSIWIGLRKKRRKNDDDNRGSTIIDPANQREIDDIVDSGNTLTDKA